LFCIGLAVVRQASSRSWGIFQRHWRIWTTGKGRRK